MNIFPEPTYVRLLREIPAISESSATPVIVPLLSRNLLRNSKGHFTPKWAARYLAIGEVTMEEVFLPLLQRCRQNYRVAKRQATDSGWYATLTACAHNLEVMEEKWANTVNASSRMRKAAGLPVRAWPK